MKFAHLADIHLGFQKNHELQKIEQDVFEQAMDECIGRRVDFILIPGDMFHVNIPEMRVQKYAFAKFRQVHEAGIPVYVVYGSHDFSPVSDSVIDLLEKTGYITKVTKSRNNDNGTIALDFTTDKKTGVKLTGLPGLKAGGDSKYYELLDREPLESEPGFKIFLFHGGISEMKSDRGAQGDYMPLSMLPKGFDYYAGGHLHKYDKRSYDGYPYVVYPGTPFAGYHSDLEDNARSQQRREQARKARQVADTKDASQDASQDDTQDYLRRGFVLVEFDQIIQSVQLIEIPNTQYKIIDIDATNSKPESVQKDLDEKISNMDPSQKVVIVNVTGELASGKTTDIDFSKASENLRADSAIEVKINRNQLTSREYKITSASGKNNNEIETNVFAENIGEVISDIDAIKGDEGVKLAKSLIRILALPPLENETTSTYETRITREAIKTMGLDDQ